jgi:parvulin-like peptidyl-prolyl isomerase
MKKTNFLIFSVLFFALAAVSLSACNYKDIFKKKQPLKTSKTQVNEQNNVKAYKFAVSRSVPKAERALWVKQIQKRMAAYGYTQAKVDLTGDKEFTVSFNVPANVIFIENDFVRYMTSMPTFEIRLKDDQVTLSEEDKAQIKAYNEQALAKAKKILVEALKEPDKFGELAKKYSEDPGSKNNGGLYKGVKRGQFVPQYEEVVFGKLKDGEIYPQVVETSYGYHIIKREAGQGSGDNETVDTRHILILKKREQDVLAAKQWKETGLNGLYVRGAAAAVTKKDKNGKQQYILAIQLDKQGTAKLEGLTANNIGKQMAIFIDETAVAAPKIKGEIKNGQIILNGIFTQQGAANLANNFNGGAAYAPVSFVGPLTKEK